MNKTVLITGATDGIGKQTANEMANSGYQLILHGRNDDTVKRTVNEISQQSGNKHIAGLEADLASLDEVKQLAEQVRQQYDTLDILINNAGIYQDRREMTGDGFEKTFQVNYLSHFLLTNKLLKLLKKRDDSRIVNVASMVHSTAIDFDNLQGEQRFDGSEAYGLSKLCNVLFTYKLARILDDTSVTVNCLHPGVIDTKLLRKNWPGIGGPVKEGAENILFVATHPSLEEVSGKYFVNKMPQSSATASYEHDKQDRLWKISHEMVKNQL